MVEDSIHGMMVSLMKGNSLIIISLEKDFIAGLTEGSSEKILV